VCEREAGSAGVGSASGSRAECWGLWRNIGPSVGRKRWLPMCGERDVQLFERLRGDVVLRLVLLQLFHSAPVSGYAALGSALRRVTQAGLPGSSHDRRSLSRTPVREW